MKRVLGVSTVQDNYCENFCKLGLSLLGLNESRKFTFLSLFISSCLVISFASWIYSFSQVGGEDIEVLHHLTLNMMAIGLYLAFYLRQADLIAICRLADTFTYSDDSLRRGYEALKDKEFSSGMKRFTDFFNLQVLLAWINIIRTNFVFAFSGAEVRAPPSLIVPFKSNWTVALAHVTELMFIVTGILVDLFIQQAFMTISIQLTVQFKTLQFAISSLHSDLQVGKDGTYRSDEAALNLKTRECIRHHQLILRGFQCLKSFCGPFFHFVYFGIVWAIAFCRTLIIGEHIDFVSVASLLFLEITFMGLFCSFADRLSAASEGVGRSAYLAPWHLFPKSTCKALQLIICRSAKPPTMRFFIGGNYVTCETITVVLNATITYFMVSILLQ